MCRKKMLNSFVLPFAMYLANRRIYPLCLRNFLGSFEYGIAIDASAIAGFGDETHSDLFLHPEPDTLMPLPWRPEHGCVVRMFCSITYPDGKIFECDTRSILKKQFRPLNMPVINFLWCRTGVLSIPIR
mgnify:CR=1 FL=1